METQDILAKAHDKNIPVTWEESHKYTPGARHRRRLILRMIAGLDFADVLDAGCAQPHLLHDIVERYKVPGFGCDLSDQVMGTNKDCLPQCEFRTLNLAQETWPGGRQFDLVVCSEVLEHIWDWETALANLVRMTRKHLVITVPSGKLRLVEKMLGHYRHYEGKELAHALAQNGCSDIRLRKWGFPVYSMFRLAVSGVAPTTLYSAFCSAERKYTWSQKLVAHSLTGLFYINDLFRQGGLLFAYACAPQISRS